MAHMRLDSAIASCICGILFKKCDLLSVYLGGPFGDIRCMVSLLYDLHPRLQALNPTQALQSSAFRSLVRFFG